MTTGKKTRKSKKGGMLPLAAIAASVPIVIDIVKEIIDKKGSGCDRRHGNKVPTRIPRGNGTRIPRGSGKKPRKKIKTYQ